jgi:FlaA1/EpsC-like NDP-sugar epimerase
MILGDKNTPRWIVFLLDIALSLLALAGAYLIRFDFLSIPFDKEIPVLAMALPVFVAVRALTYYFGKTYAGIIRYTSTEDAKRIVLVATLGSLIFIGLTPIRYYFVDGFYFLPLSIIIIDYLLTIFLLIASRVAVKLIFLERRKSTSESKNIIIFGAGELGLITKRTLDRDAGSKYNVTAFVDDNKSKVGKKMEGVNIHHSDRLGDLIEKHDIAQVIIGILNPDPEHKRAVIDACLIHNVEVLNIPPVNNWINGELSFNQIKKVRIEDLLGRDPIKLDKDAVSKTVNDKTILVTGAAGSIGSEIVRQLLRFSPAKIVLLDQAESPLFELDLELRGIFKSEKHEIVIGDIRNRERVENVFETFKPNMVFHAAAYKHVPLMEENPSEAIFTNVLGSKHLVDVAIEHKVEEFVLISTDKAVNPTSVMGASKRIAEIYAQRKNTADGTKFITTRFGNVLGSNGSVIPLFRKQIERGGPLTVTHAEVTRFFMTIPEACQLVLEAGAMGNGGEIFIFDMGESVKILDLATKMIKLSGLELDKDIRIEITGLRPGEKLYEELLSNEENTVPTHHPQILIAQVAEYDEAAVVSDISELTDMFRDQNNEMIVKKMKAIVPEYKSNNSVFTKLDE